MTIALIGNTIEPKARNSRTNVDSAMIRAIHGSRCPRPCSRSTICAVAPPRWTSLTCAGGVRSRTLARTDLAPPASASPAYVTLTTAVSPRTAETLALVAPGTARACCT